MSGEEGFCLSLAAKFLGKIVPVTFTGTSVLVLLELRIGRANKFQCQEKMFKHFQGELELATADLL